MRSAVIVFPGSNCDDDMRHALQLMGSEVDFVWHKSGSLNGYDLAVLPGGFSYGDYLRCGAIARFSPIMNAVIEFARKGRPVLGICNGFQTLVEAGLLPGALLPNHRLRFVCRPVFLRVENTDTRFTCAIPPDTLLQIPIAHGEGRYFWEEEELQKLEDNQRIVFRYVDRQGRRSETANPNGSANDIAGIINSAGNVLGMMPHPERAVEKLLGSDDGRKIFQSLLSS